MLVPPKFLKCGPLERLEVPHGAEVGLELGSGVALPGLAALFGIECERGGNGGSTCALDALPSVSATSILAGEGWRAGRAFDEVCIDWTP